MGWRMTLVFKPLFGERTFIKNFYETAGKQFNEVGNEAFSFEEYKGDACEMANNIANIYPGIIFYGYRIEDTTCGQWIFRQIIFNKQDGVFFLGKKTYCTDEEKDIIIENLCIRGMKNNRDHARRAVEEGWKLPYNPETYLEKELEFDNDDADGGYCLQL